MRPSALSNTPIEPQRRGFLSRLFTRCAATKKTSSFKKALVAMLAFALAAGSVAAPNDAHAAKRKNRAPAKRTAVVQPSLTPASIVLDVEGNRTFNEFNADTRIHPASTTKLMTAYLVFEALDSGRLRAEQHLTVSANAAAQPRTNLALRAGSTITVDQALRGLMVHSANDAAVVLGEAVGGNRAAFSRMMNTQARELGMHKSTFTNANGLGDPNQRVTARDMSRLMVAIFRDHPELARRYLAVPSFSFNGGSWTNTNRLLNSAQCPGIIGGKTGYIRAAGTNIVVMAERNDRHVVVGVFGRMTGAIRNDLTCNLINFAYYKMLRDPAATYNPDLSYEIIMPPVVAIPSLPPVTTQAPIPTTDPDTFWPVPPPQKPPASPFSPNRDIETQQPLPENNHWPNPAVQKSPQNGTDHMIFKSVSTGYSLRFNG